MLTSRSTYKNTPSPPEVKVSLVIFVRAFKCSSWSSPSKCVCWPWVDSLDVKNQSPGSKYQVVKKWLSIWNINKYKNKYILIIVIWKKSVNIVALIEMYIYTCIFSLSSPHLSVHVVHHVPCIWSFLIWKAVIMHRAHLCLYLPFFLLQGSDWLCKRKN